MPAGVALLAAAGAAVSLAGWWGRRRWNALTDAVRARLTSHARAVALPFAPPDLDGLPCPVARYFRRALADGQPRISRARISWAGQFNMGRPGADKWVPFTATQDFVPGAPGMVWDARIRMAPGVVVCVRDSLVDGQGSMYGAMFGWFPVAKASGTPAMARASLQRYLAEAAWFPTALLPAEGVRWTSIDETRALATLTAGEVSASVEFRFDDEGRPVSTFVPDRLYDDRRGPPSLQRWQGRNLSFTTADGLLVPDEATVEWLLPGGAFAYWRGRPVACRFDYAALPHPRH